MVVVDPGSFVQMVSVLIWRNNIHEGQNAQEGKSFPALAQTFIQHHCLSHGTVASIHVRYGIQHSVLAGINPYVTFDGTHMLGSGEIAINSVNSQYIPLTLTDV